MHAIHQLIRHQRKYPMKMRQKFLQGSLVELNHEGFANPKLIKLMSCNEKLKCWKIRRILRYRVPNNVRF